MGLDDVVHVDELHVESDDLVTEVVDVTGGSDDEAWGVDGVNGYHSENHQGPGTVGHGLSFMG